MELTQSTRDFIAAHLNEDVREVALHAKPQEGLDLNLALNQIAGYQTARTKLPDWAATKDIIYPPHLNMEQCSSQATAEYKAKLAATLTKNRQAEPRIMVDLTGGFGVDFSYIARDFAQADYVERNADLCALAEHNMKALQLMQARIHNTTAEDYLKALPEDAVTLIFLDPARRDAHGGKVVAVEDCTPNVLELKEELLSKSSQVMVKLSPMLDWRKAVRDFDGSVSEVHIVSVGNECKELLLVLGRERTQSPQVVCVNDADIFAYDSARAHAKRGVRVPERARYLYEPNSSLMKAGCFDLLEETFGVSQVDSNSHLFVSEELVENFPGRVFEIESTGGMGKKERKSLLAGVKKANVSVRNFPLTVAQLRAKLKLADGGDVYLFATTMEGKHVLIRTRKLAERK